MEARGCLAVMEAATVEVGLGVGEMAGLGAAGLGVERG